MQTHFREDRLRTGDSDAQVHIFDLPDSADGFIDEQIVSLLRKDPKLPRRNGVIVATPDWQQGGEELTAQDKSIEQRLVVLKRIANVLGLSEADALVILAPFADTINELSWQEVQLFALSLFTAHEQRKHLKMILGQAAPIDIIVPELAVGKKRRDLRGVLLTPNCVDQFLAAWSKAQIARMPVITTGFVLNSSRPEELSSTVTALAEADDATTSLHSFSLRAAAVSGLLLAQAGCLSVTYSQRNGERVTERSIMDATRFLSSVSKKA